MYRATLLTSITIFAFTACAPADEAAEPMAAQDAMPQAATTEAVTGEDMAAVANPYDAILAGDQRSAENRARDQYRNPAETLQFFGVEPGMTVVEVSPGGGWYTEVLAPALGPQGKLYAAHTDPASSERAAAAVSRFDEKLTGHPVYANTERTVFTKDSPDTLAPAGSADMVLTFRNVHNFHMNDFGEEAFGAFYRALKPGGVLGVVDHRLPEDAEDARMEKSGYMKRSTVVDLAQQAGFELVEESEINANPRDTADYEGGVWTLPPTLAGGDENRERYAAIGESDRMTLKFRKPG